ncbi:MAG: TSUP family transporter [Candidatus Eisenbacteria bacterium]|nr:TSUP family transporter [Candidatus Eisenbacteria bacterium]
MTAPTLILLGLAGTLAGFIDSIAGGGGIITVPALLSAGLPPHLALGTNKLQSSFGSLTATLRYRHGKLVKIRRTLPGILFTTIGATVGTLTIQRISPGFLQKAIPILLLAVFVYMLFSPKAGAKRNRSMLTPLPFYVLMGLGIGFYDGFFGPGTGSFWTVAFVVLLGQELKEATAHTKVMNFTSNVVALATFAIGGHVVLVPGLAMGAGEVLGAYMGSHLVIRRGVGFIRVFFLTVVAVTLARLVYVTYIG